MIYVGVLSDSNIVGEARGGGNISVGVLSDSYIVEGGGGGKVT